MMSGELAYEGSDESSENELLEKSLSVWRGWNAVEREEFVPIPLDLHTACSIGHYDTVRLYINSKEDLNCKNRGGWTPLMYACYIGHDNIVNLLLEVGVDVNCKNPKGQTALMLAASCGNESVGYFLYQQGAELENQDKRGWTALFHATYSGHQNMVKFLLEQGANMNAIEPCHGITPFMEAAAEGHEIIVQIFLQHQVNVNAKAFSGDTARSLALLKGHMKIVSLIDNHIIQSPVRTDPGLFSELSSSDESGSSNRSPTVRSKGRGKGPSIRDGPEAFARYLDRSRCPNTGIPEPNSYIPKGYMTFSTTQVEGDNSTDVQIRSRDVTSPISAIDQSLDSSAGKEAGESEEDWNSFSKTGALTIKSNSSSSGGLAAAFGISRDNSLDSAEDMGGNLLPEDLASGQSCLPGTRTPADGANDTALSSTPQPPVSQNTDHCTVWSNNQPFSLFCQNESPVPPVMLPSQPDSIAAVDNFSRTVNSVTSVNHVVQDMWALQLDTTPGSKDSDSDKHRTFITQDSTGVLSPQPRSVSNTPGLPKPSDAPHDLYTLLEQIGMSQYRKTFDQQDVDLQVFLSLTENDLKEIGVKLFGHRRKMTIAIARWHSNAQLYMDNLEQVYANKLEAEMQEMAIQLHKVYDENKRLKAQVLQEKELRSVTESCLVEERSSWQHTQHLLRETRQCCHQLAAVFRRLKYQQSEVKRRSLPGRLMWEDLANQESCVQNPVQSTNQQTVSPTSPSHSANPQGPSKTSSSPSLTSFDDLFWEIDCYLKHLEQNIILIKQNTDRLYSPKQIEIPIAGGSVQ